MMLCLAGALSPFFAGAQGLVNCGTGTYKDSSEYDCNFTKAVEMINTLISYMIVVAMPISAIAFAYAGWLYLSAVDNPGQVTKAKHVFISVGIGFILILSGWLIFKLIATEFLDLKYKDSTYLN